MDSAVEAVADMINKATKMTTLNLCDQVGTRPIKISVEYQSLLHPNGKLTISDYSDSSNVIYTTSFGRTSSDEILIATSILGDTC